MSTFSPGEVAIFVGPDSANYGDELTVVSPLLDLYLFDRHLMRNVWAKAHMVEAPWMPPPPPDGKGFWAARPEHLRKRPPRQDWEKLAALDRAPTELESA